MALVSLDDLNDDVLHVLCQQLLRIGDGKRAITALASSSKRMCDLARCYIFRDITIANAPGTTFKAEQLFRELRRVPSAMKTLRRFTLHQRGDDTGTLEGVAFFSPTDLFRFLSRLERLTELRLLGLPLMFVNVSQVREMMRRYKFPALKTITTTTDVGLSMLRVCPILEELHLESLPTDIHFLEIILRHETYASIRSLNFDFQGFGLLGDAISMIFPNIKTLGLGPPAQQLRQLEKLLQLVHSLPHLENLTMPDILDCGDDDRFSDCMEDHKLCTEIVSRKLFISCPTLLQVSWIADLSNWGSRSASEENDTDILKAERNEDESVVALEWIEQNAFIRDRYGGGKLIKTFENVDNWIEVYGIEAREYLQLYGAR